MARPLRIEYPGAFYHVINRGQRREAIFDDDRDRERFLSCLARMSTLFRVRLHAYCLMTNHYHLILETSEANLSRAIQWLNVSYAVYYNQRHEYAGHVFQGRFKAILVEADSYLEPLSRYIHLNPVRVELVKQPWKYAWSSCRYFVTTETPPDWLDAQRVLMGFGRYRKTQRRRYRKYLLTSNQVKDVDIRRRGAKRNQPRDVAIYLARELSGHSGQELGEEFGKISGAAISARCKHIDEAWAANRKLKRDIREIRTAISNN